MPSPNLALVGLQPAAELNTTQFVIAAGGGATFTASNNIGTVTFNAAHGLTMVPAATTTLPNFYISFGGSTSGLSGTGILVGNFFRILTIPSTTAITIYTTITAATVTSLTGIPVFFPSFGIATANTFRQNQTVSSTVVQEPGPLEASCLFSVTNGANCVLQYNPGGTLVPLDQTTGNTPATAPTMRTAVAASAGGQVFGAYPWMALVANGTTATSYVSVYR